MHAHLNSMTWFFCGTSISLLAAFAFFLVWGGGREALGLMLFGPILLVVGTLMFWPVTILASRVTSEGHRYLLSLTTGLLCPFCLRGLGLLLPLLAPTEPPLAVTTLLIVVGVVVSECVPFGAGWLILYGPRYYRDYLAP